MKNKFINIIIFFLIIAVLSVGLIIKGDTAISTDERRPLKQSDTLTKNVLDGTFSTRLEDYLMDQFPLRYSFRKLKSFANYNVFMKLENEDITVQDGYAIKLQEHYKYDQVGNTVEKIHTVRETVFKNNKNVYMTMIPDKSYFYTGEPSQKCDFDRVEEYVKSHLNNISYFSIKHLLSLDDYYKTDSHWNQSKILDIRNHILKQMGIENPEMSYVINTEHNFIGVYASQAALSRNGEDIEYLLNDNLKDCVVINHENGEQIPLYNLDLIHQEENYDKYEMFLSGSKALLEINNPNATTNKILYICRDSFGSSLTPLLVESYKTIYVIDLRYINSSYITNKIGKINRTADVLFMYSTLLMETPGNFQVK